MRVFVKTEQDARTGAEVETRIGDILYPLFECDIVGLHIFAERERGEGDLKKTVQVVHG